MPIWNHLVIPAGSRTAMPMIVFPLGFTGGDFWFGHHDSLSLLFGNPPLSAVLVREISNCGVGAPPGNLMLVSSSGGSLQQATVSGKLCVSPDISSLWAIFHSLSSVRKVFWVGFFFWMGGVDKWFEGVLVDELEPEKEGSPRASHFLHLLPLIQVPSTLSKENGEYRAVFCIYSRINVTDFPSKK